MINKGKVDDNEINENKNCECGGIFFANFNKCNKVKIYKIILLKKINYEKI